MPSENKIWLITGASRGLGLSLARTVAGSGDVAIAASRSGLSPDARNMAGNDNLVGEVFDVTDAHGADTLVRKIIDRFGRIDVLVNNAGFGSLAAFEQTDAQHFRLQIETNFFGTVNLVRAVLPLMRERRSGTIINVSSNIARIGVPGMSAYCAAKAATSIFTESLSREVAGFGVRAIAVEPGSMRTDWSATAIADIVPPLPEYQSTVGQLVEFAGRTVGQEPGDPDRYAQIIYDLARRDTLPERLVLGPAALKMVEDADLARETIAAEWHDVSISTDFPTKSPD